MITITGSSDDLILVGGAVREEFGVDENGHLTLSDGTVLVYAYTGVWRFEVERAGSATLSIERCSGDEDADVYTDKVTVTSPIEWVRQGIHEVPGVGDIPETFVDNVRAATVDRDAVAGMTIREVHDRCLDALEGGQQTAGASAELDYTHDLLNALDEELRELRGQEAELAKLREFARQVAPVILEEFKPVAEDGEIMPWMEAHLDAEVLDKLTELAEDLDLGWEARA